jgi:hypothetical protein
MYARHASAWENCYVQGKCCCESQTVSLDFSFGSPFDIMGSLIEEARVLREVRLQLDEILYRELLDIVLSYVA